jgi:RNA polymerase sigma-70 factor (ECF subfamily)
MAIGKGPELEAALAAARSAWPRLALTDDAFLAHLEARLDDETRVEDLNVPDLFLACACVHRVEGAADAFAARYLANPGGYLRGVTTDAATVDDVRQIVSEKLLVGDGDAGPRIADYSGRGSLLNWVRTVVVRAALDLVRAGRRHRGDQVVEQIKADATRDPELEHIKQRYQGDFTRALQDALGALSAEQRTWLKLHLLDGLTIDELAGLYRIHRATAARRLVAARTAVLEGTRARLRERLQLTKSQFDDLAQVLRSQLDISLSAILRGAA